MRTVHNNLPEGNCWVSREVSLRGESRTTVSYYTVYVPKHKCFQITGISGQAPSSIACFSAFDICSGDPSLTDSLLIPGGHAVTNRGKPDYQYWPVLSTAIQMSSVTPNISTGCITIPEQVLIFPLVDNSGVNQSFQVLDLWERCRSLNLSQSSMFQWIPFFPYHGSWNVYVLYAHPHHHIPRVQCL